MKILVTGSSGHLGEALVRTLRERGDAVTGFDLTPSPFTDVMGSVADRSVVHAAMAGVDLVLHTATLHKPHVATHSRQDFIDTNITGTLNLLEEAVAANVGAFVYTSTTSVFGDALNPPKGAPAAWVTEDVAPVPKNIYGVTKSAAEDLCQIVWRNHRLPIIVLRTSRFFPEEDDSATARAAHDDDNIKSNEFLHRRVAIEDVVSAHLAAAGRAGEIGFGKYIISATTPFHREDMAELRADPAAIMRRRVPEYEAEYRRRSWSPPADLGRVYVNEKARRELGWQPEHDFHRIIARLAAGEGIPGPLARAIGYKRYHAERFAEGPYPVDHS